MRGSRRKASHQESGLSSFSEADHGSVLIASLKIKKGKKWSSSKIFNPKSNPHFKKIRSALSKKTVSDSSSKGARSGSTNKKLIHKKILHKALDKKSASKLSSPKPQAKHSIRDGSKRSGKVTKKDVTVNKFRKGKNKRRQEDKVDADEPSRLQRRARYLMIKMKLEQNLLDAYSGEGWKGQSREKIKPERELMRAMKQILKCKLGIRDAIRQLDLLSTVGSIEDSFMAPDGSVSHEHIFCAKCKLNEVSPDNDIVLCDGTCNCGFHQKCLDPPLDTESIPPGEQGWFCKFCECRIEIIDAMNAHLGTRFSIDESWQDIFREEAAFPDGGSMLLNPEEEWPSDDSEDENYDPERRENSMSGAGTDDDRSEDVSSSTSLVLSSDGDIISGSQRGEMEGIKYHSTYSSVDSDGTSEGEIMCGRRQRRTVDYKKLYDEMFGKDAHAHEQVTEDEDWGPGKRKRRGKVSDAASTLMTLYESEKKSKKVGAMEVMRKLPRDSQIQRSFFRMPPYALEKLRQAFAENELPSRTVKENLSNDLGLEPGKVSKWFKNARYLALKSRKTGRGKQLCGSCPRISDESILDDTKNKVPDLVMLKDTPRRIGVHAEKNFKMVRKRPKSISKSLKKNEQQRGSLELPVMSNNEMSPECSDDLNLKKLVKAKTKGRKKNSSGTGESQAAEHEMERLSKAKARLERLKQMLARLQTAKGRKSRKTHLPGESVVYVPIAELKEKKLILCSQ